MTNAVEFKPKKLAQVVGQVTGSEPKPILVPGSSKTKVSRQNWDDLKALSNEIAQGIVQMAESLKETDALVQKHGCIHRTEYNIVVQRASQYLNQFTDDYIKIVNRHKDYSGFVADENENALLLSIFEDYRAFQTLFQGAMMHTAIAFTEYALEANDIAKEKAEKEAEKESSATNPVTEG